MASVYFDPAVGGDGSTVTDDTSPTTGLANGGHRTRFVPSLAQIVAVATNAITSATNASTSAGTATTKAAEALASANAAAAAYDQLDDRWLGAKASAPTLDNDGNALATGATYWNTTSDKTFVWSGSVWVDQTFVPTTASGVAFTPAGGIAATNVQTALAELDTEKARLDGGTHTGTHVFNGTLTLTGATVTVATAALNDNDTSPASTAFVQNQIAAIPQSPGGVLALFTLGVI